MTVIDTAIEKAINDFTLYYERNREELDRQNEGKEDPFAIYPPEFWSESDIQYWFRQSFLNFLKKKDYTVHTEVAINDWIFNGDRICEFNEHIKADRAIKVDLAIFPRDFEGGKPNSTANLFVEFKFATGISRPLEIDANSKLREGKGKEWQMEVEIYRLKKALDLNLAEVGLVFCLHDVIGKSTPSNKLKRRIIKVPRYPNIRVVLLERL